MKRLLSCASLLAALLLPVHRDGAKAADACGLNRCKLSGPLDLGGFALAGTGAISSLGTITVGTWNATVIAGQYGGTGVPNTGKTLTLGASVTINNGTAGNCPSYSAAGTIADGVACNWPMGVLGKLTGANMNTTADQPISLNLGSATKYIPGTAATTTASLVMAVTGCTADVSTTTAALYRSGSKANAFTSVTTLSSLTGASTDLQRVALSGATSTAYSANPLYFALTAVKGSAATCDVYVFGVPLP